MSDRWFLAQKYERETWNSDKDRILSQEYIETKRIYSEGILKWLMNFKNITEDSRILQIGSAGEGEIFFFNIGYRYAIDPLADFYIKQFKTIQDKRVAFLKGAGETLPWKDNFFDVIILFNVLDHVKVPNMVLDEIHRSLKIGGIAYIGVHAYSWTGRAFRNGREIIHNIYSNIKIDNGHPHSFSPHSLEKIINNYFTIVDTKHDSKNFEYLDSKGIRKLRKYLNGKKMYRFILITIPRSSAAVGTGQSNIFKRVYTFYIDDRIKACKPLCV